MNLRTHIDRFMEIFLPGLMAVLVLNVLWQVISRYVMKTPSSFTDELAGFLLIWVGLFGAAYVAGKDEHLAIDLLLQRSSERRRRGLRILIHTCIFFFAAIVMVAGGSWLVYTRFMLSVKSAALQIPLGYVYLVLPLSGALICYYATDDLLKWIKSKPQY